jgi:protein-S-isoprenylcysteine O-methyltransferase Ste14
MRDYEKVFFAFFTPLMFVIPLVAGLDYGGFIGLWNMLPIGVPLWLIILGFCLVVVGEALFGWAMVVNPFFHGMLKIQTDRGHKLVSKGPYRWIRHPGYLGQLLFYLGTPLLLGSWWALFLGLLMALIFVYRTAREDQILQSELSGYDDYVGEVRRRLIPGVW